MSCSPESGLEVERVEHFDMELEFESWFARTQTPDADAERARELLAAAQLAGRPDVDVPDDHPAREEGRHERPLERPRRGVPLVGDACDATPTSTSWSSCAIRTRA